MRESQSDLIKEPGSDLKLFGDPILPPRGWINTEGKINPGRSIDDGEFVVTAEREEEVENENRRLELLAREIALLPKYDQDTFLEEFYALSKKLHEVLALNDNSKDKLRPLLADYLSSYYILREKLSLESLEKRVDQLPDMIPPVRSDLALAVEIAKDKLDSLAENRENKTNRLNPDLKKDFDNFRQEIWSKIADAERTVRQLNNRTSEISVKKAVNQTRSNVFRREKRPAVVIPDLPMDPKLKVEKPTVAPHRESRHPLTRKDHFKPTSELTETLAKIDLISRGDEVWVGKELPIVLADQVMEQMNLYQLKAHLLVKSIEINNSIINGDSKNLQSLIEEIMTKYLNYCFTTNYVPNAEHHLRLIAITSAHKFASDLITNFNNAFIAWKKGRSFVGRFFDGLLSIDEKKSRENFAKKYFDYNKETNNGAETMHDVILGVIRFKAGIGAVKEGLTDKISMPTTLRDSSGIKKDKIIDALILATVLSGAAGLTYHEYQNRKKQIIPISDTVKASRTQQREVRSPKVASLPTQKREVVLPSLDDIKIEKQPLPDDELVDEPGMLHLLPDFKPESGIDIYDLKKGQGILHAINHFTQDKPTRAQIIIALHRAHPEWVHDFNSKPRLRYGQPVKGDQTQWLGDNLLHRWRLEQALNHNSVTFLPGARLKLSFENNYPTVSVEKTTGHTLPKSKAGQALDKLELIHGSD